MTDLGMMTDELNKVIMEVEKALGNLELGVTSSVPFKHLTGEGKLRFGKEDGAWRLMVDHPDGSYSFLSNTSRETRCAAMKVLGDLHKALLAEADAQRTVVADAIETARGFVKWLEMGIL